MSLPGIVFFAKTYSVFLTTSVYISFILSPCDFKNPCKGFVGFLSSSKAILAEGPLTISSLSGCLSPMFSINKTKRLGVA